MGNTIRIDGKARASDLAERITQAPNSPPGMASSPDWRW
jgi:hypothetical protein